MDSSSSSQNWLAFSLSHPHHYPAATAYDSNVNSSDCNDNSIDLSMFNSVGPKLEDFLGSNNGGSSSSLAQFSTENNQSDNNNGVYDSIAASFLRGYSSSLSNNGNGNTSVPTEMIDNYAIVPVTTASTVVPVDSSKKAVDTFGQRTSIYRGVTRHRWTGRYEAHLWDNSCRREGQSRKGRQVYLGGYDKEEKAARAYDLAALKYWGSTTTTNFPVCNYEKELEEMKNMSRQEFVASLRRKSSGFSRGASIYRGVTRHHQHGRWQARIGRVAGNKDLYLGTFSTQEEAAEAYDIAAIKFRGLNAVTNFDMSRYDVKSIASSSLPIGGIANKPKASPESVSDNGTRSSEDMSSVSFASQPASSTTTLSFALPIKQDASDYWSMLGYQNSLSQQMKNGTATTTGNNFQSNGTTFMDFSSSSDQSQAQAVFNGGGYVQQQEQQQEQVQQEQENSNGLIPYATPINSYDTSTGYGSWVTPSVHTFQTGKPNISVYQTPIYGME